jgi:putative two-component system hydrogenase maturation factor HypX/HoxX
MTLTDRAIDWSRDSTAAILARLNAADGFPGVADELFGQPCHLYDAWPEASLKGVPGSLLGRRETAICRATVDAAIWIGHVKRTGWYQVADHARFAEAAALPELPLAGGNRRHRPGRILLTKKRASGFSASSSTTVQ